MVYVADSESWQRIFQLVAENSRWDLQEDDVSRYMARSYDFIMDLLQRFDSSEPFALDPAGEQQLHRAKQVRRARAAPGPDRGGGGSGSPFWAARVLPALRRRPLRSALPAARGRPTAD